MNIFEGGLTGPFPLQLDFLFAGDILRHSMLVYVTRRVQRIEDQVYCRSCLYGCQCCK